MTPEKIFDLGQRIMEARDNLPVGMPDGYKDILAGVIAFGLDELLTKSFERPGPRCTEHFDWPRCEVCDKPVIPPGPPFGAMYPS